MENMKHEKEKTKHSIKNFLTTLLLYIFIIIMVISGTKIIEWINDNKKSKDIIGEIQSSIIINQDINSIEKYNIDFQNLKKINSDTCAWIKVKGTDIEYPVVITTNNDYYMTHSFDKSENGAGWVFVDYRNKANGLERNMVVYGHNRRDGSMFGTLKNILTEEWQNNPENFVIPFITENEKFEYQVFSVYRVEKEDYYITTDFTSDNEFQNFIDTVKTRSEKDFKIDVTTDDNILTLSTCADDNRYRVVLHGKKIK